jgi:hypothetical protein
MDWSRKDSMDAVLVASRHNDVVTSLCCLALLLQPPRFSVSRGVRCRLTGATSA